MKRTRLTVMALIIAITSAGAILPGMVNAQEPLQFSCSNQVYKAFEIEKILAFTQATGIQVDVFTSSSGSATYRLMSGYSDIAATARGLHRSYKDSGYTQIAICKDPLAVIAKSACGVDSLTQTQLADIFSGSVRNWKEVGGADLPITVIVPDKDTAANKNFRRQVMKHQEIQFDFMAYNSTMVIEAVKHFPCGAISFISQGAVAHQAPIKTIKIDGLGPELADYPFFQTFYYVTKGKPSGFAKKFIDFTFSDAGAKIIRNNGMLPLSR